MDRHVSSDAAIKLLGQSLHDEVFFVQQAFSDFLLFAFFSRNQSSFENFATPTPIGHGFI